MAETAEDQGRSSQDKGSWLSWSEASKTAIVFASVIIIIALALCLYHISDESRRSSEDFFTAEPEFTNESILDRVKQELAPIPREKPSQSDPEEHTTFIAYYSAPISLLACGITLLIRAFLPGISILRGLALIVGGFLFYWGLLFILTMFYYYGLPQRLFEDSATLAGMAVFPLVGAVMLIVGIRPRRKRG